MALGWLRWRASAGVAGWPPRLLAWQAWHFATSTLVSRGRRGRRGTYGVALCDSHLGFTWQAWYLAATPFRLHHAHATAPLVEKISVLADLPYMHACMHTYIHRYIHRYIHTYIPTYIHIYIYTYIHPSMHAYIHTLHYITLHYITLHYITLHYITLHYITLHYLQYSTVQYITLHYIHTYNTTCPYTTYSHLLSHTQLTPHQSFTISFLFPAFPMPSLPFFCCLLEEVDMWGYPVL